MTTETTPCPIRSEIEETMIGMCSRGMPTPPPDEPEDERLHWIADRTASGRAEVWASNDYSRCIAHIITHGTDDEAMQTAKLMANAPYLLLALRTLMRAVAPYVDPKDTDLMHAIWLAGDAISEADGDDAGDDDETITLIDVEVS